MLVIGAPEVAALPEAENQGQLVLGHIVAPKFPVLDEADDIFLVIFSIFHRRIQDAQLHALLRENVQGGVEDTIRLPVVIQQIHAL